VEGKGSSAGGHYDAASKVLWVGGWGGVSQSLITLSQYIHASTCSMVFFFNISAPEDETILLP